LHCSISKDGLEKCAIHSTDTHGTNHVNFALLHLFGYRFAPRYRNVRGKVETGLYGFRHPKHYNRDWPIKPITLGGALKRKERLSARLGDVLSELYLASATLKHFIDQGSRESDLPLMRWACDDSLYRIQAALRSLFRNLPFPPLAWILKLLVFPTGLPYGKPCDHLGHTAARTLLSTSGVRDRLTDGIFKWSCSCTYTRKLRRWRNIAKYFVSRHSTHAGLNYRCWW